MPVIAVQQLHRGPEVVGFLFAAPAAGALLVTLVSGPLTRMRRQGDAVVWAVVAGAPRSPRSGSRRSSVCGALLPRGGGRRRRGERDLPIHDPAGHLARSPRAGSAPCSSSSSPAGRAWRHRSRARRLGVHRHDQRGDWRIGVHHRRVRDGAHLSGAPRVSHEKQNRPSKRRRSVAAGSTPHRAVVSRRSSRRARTRARTGRASRAPSRRSAGPGRWANAKTHSVAPSCVQGRCRARTRRADRARSSGSSRCRVRDRMRRRPESIQVATSPWNARAPSTEPSR